MRILFDFKRWIIIEESHRTRNESVVLWDVHFFMSHTWCWCVFEEKYFKQLRIKCDIFNSHRFNFEFSMHYSLLFLSLPWSKEEGNSISSERPEETRNDPPVSLMKFLDFPHFHSLIHDKVNLRIPSSSSYFVFWDFYEIIKFPSEEKWRSWETFLFIFVTNLKHFSSTWPVYSHHQHCFMG